MSQFPQSILPLFEVTRAEWLARARDAARTLGMTGKPVTIDDVREICPPPAECDPRVMGGVFSRGSWQKVGYKNSDRTECHGRPVAMFRLTEAMVNREVALEV